jgi:multimeric flavodoxin WrbA
VTVQELLVVHHTPSIAVRQLLEAIVAGARQPELAEVKVVLEPALSATPSDVFGCAGILLLTPANIGYMSGALKHFFDGIYYPCMDATRGLLFGLVVHGNDDTTGAIRSVDKVTTALGWQRAARPVSVLGPPQPADLDAAAELAATVAARILPG